MSIRRTSFLGALVGCVLVTLFSSGCGTSQYNALMNRRLAALRGEAKFRHLYAPTRLPDTPISIRIPMVFGKSYQANSAHDDDGAAINPARLQPPFLKLPGFKLCYEGVHKAGAEQFPFYCYLAAVPTRQGEIDILAGQLQAQLNRAFPSKADPMNKDAAQAGAAPQTAPAWETVDAEAPTGFSVHWRKIRFDGSQPFLVKTDKVAPQTLPGKLELWLHDAGDYIVLVAWRAPDQAIGPSAAATGDATSVKRALSGPPDDAKLDLDSMPTATAGTITVDKSQGT
jgi:hypothetical protein